ncbi:uncharacterized protein LOC109727836 [Ananas comosus]|uniref:Uncharacterized protein LOC109727836 n=1 Tax=Ananas comosus TaxID=4615 RepID=A0A6P5HFH1_ANACO|nr:uncharacterized protein LOC109727836 [Ananas comosus]
MKGPNAVHEATSACVDLVPTPPTAWSPDFVFSFLLRWSARGGPSLCCVPTPRAAYSRPPAALSLRPNQQLAGRPGCPAPRPAMRREPRPAAGGPPPTPVACARGWPRPAGQARRSSRGAPASELARVRTRHTVPAASAAAPAHASTRGSPRPKPSPAPRPPRNTCAVIEE